MTRKSRNKRVKNKLRSHDNIEITSTSSHASKRKTPSLKEGFSSIPPLLDELSKLTSQKKSLSVVNNINEIHKTLSSLSDAIPPDKNILSPSERLDSLSQHGIYCNNNFGLVDEAYIDYVTMQPDINDPTDLLEDELIVLVGDFSVGRQMVVDTITSWGGLLLPRVQQPATIVVYGDNAKTELAQARKEKIPTYNLFYKITDPVLSMMAHGMGFTKTTLICRFCIRPPPIKSEAQRNQDLQVRHHSIPMLT